MRLAERYLQQLVGGALLLLLVAVALSPLSLRLLQRLDLMIYDLLLPVQASPMSGDVTVIAIDDPSIAELGRWPWSRRMHAMLIERLQALGVRAVGLDLLFSEADDPGADLRLRRAIEGIPVVLPVAPVQQPGQERIDELMPIAALATAAAGLGQVDMEIDVDGLCRSVFLYGGVGDARWPSLALAMLRADDNPVAAEYPQPPSGSGSTAWVRASQRWIPFTAHAVAPPILSFRDVLAGRFDSDLLTGKYVLVGATATGLGDRISTPGARAHERMSGVLVNAQILNGLLQGGMIRPLPGSMRSAICLLLVAAVVVGVQVASARRGLLLVLGGSAAILLCSAALLADSHYWLPPASSLLAMLLAWPAWTAWRYQRSQQLTGQLLRQLDHQASHQLSTGLPNHGMLLDQLRQLPGTSGRGSVTALMVVHINWPGSASIVLDRPISDPVLRSVRDRIRAIAGPGAFIAHLSSDDFAVLISGYPDAAAAGTAASAFLTEVQLPMPYGKEHLLLAPKIGMSLWPTPDNEDPELILRNAYTAMFKTRIDDTEQLCIYSGSVSDRVQTRSLLEQCLVFALERREFSVFYQPQVAAQDGRILGAEALLRWNNPDLGWVSPSAFIPVAEQVGLIKSIGAWVIEEACRQLLAWNELGFDDLRLGINVSPLQFLVPGLEDAIQDTVARSGVAPQRIELEITESSLMHDIDNSIRIMHRIKDFGLELAIDDFGTGYSSLSNLRDFPLDRLKIDQAFVREIGASVHAERIANTIITMGRQLGLSIVAEGVETTAQADFLRREGCDVFQGFLYGRPMHAEEFSLRLQKQRQPVAHNTT